MYIAVSEPVMQPQIKSDNSCSTCGTTPTFLVHVGEGVVITKVNIQYIIMIVIVS